METKNKWYDNPRILTWLIIGIILVIIFSSQSFSINSGIDALRTFQEIINHNITYMLILIYFLLLKTSFGKRYFDHINMIMIVFFFITLITSILTVLQTFNLTTLLSLVISLLTFIYLSHTFLRGTKLWQEFRLDKSPFNVMTNEWYFNTIVVITVILYMVNLIVTPTFDGTVLATFECIYTILFTRYIYLYGVYLDTKVENVFSKISEKKKNLPKLRSIEKNLGAYNFNGYQKFAMIIFIVLFAFGIIIGNLFPTCSSSTTLFSNTCEDGEFKFFLMILFWFGSFLLCLFFFAIGHIISLLSSINKKLK